MRQYLRQYVIGDWSLQSLDYAELSSRILSYMSSECPPSWPAHCRQMVSRAPEGVGAELPCTGPRCSPAMWPQRERAAFRALHICGPGQVPSLAGEARSVWGYCPLWGSHTIHIHMCNLNLSQPGVLFLRFWNQHWAAWPPRTPWPPRNILRGAPLLAPG